jgi:hypothetical protein
MARLRLTVHLLDVIGSQPSAHKALSQVQDGSHTGTIARGARVTKGYLTCPEAICSSYTRRLAWSSTNGAPDGPR